MAAALKVNITLVEVDLGGNRIGDASGLAVAEALRVNPALTTLWLNSSDMCGAGAFAVMDSLRENTLLTTLNLGCVYLLSAPHPSYTCTLMCPPSCAVRMACTGVLS
jgi:hypothetical protein